MTAAVAGLGVGALHALSGPDHVLGIARFVAARRGGAWRVGAAWGVPTPAAGGARVVTRIRRWGLNRRRRGGARALSAPHGADGCVSCDSWPFRAAHLPMRRVPELSQRIRSIDAARGVAVALMVLSHTVKGLMTFKMMPDFGIVPVHLVTKFSSSLFFLTFGASVAVVYFPRIDDGESWRRVRRRLLWRGLLIMASYKVLTVVQMYERNDRQTIIDALLWRQFPDFVEVLQFYGFFMLALPLFLRPVSRLSVVGLLFLAWALLLGSDVVREAWDFGGNWQLEAVLVESPRAFCFGLFPRGGLVLAGMAIGQALWQAPSSAHPGDLGALRANADPMARRRQVGSALVALGAAALCTFFAAHRDELGDVVTALAKNWGKHPPNVAFLLWSAGGAVLVLGLLLRLEAEGVRPLAWLDLLGRESLLCFNVHVLVIFLIFRHAFGLRHEVGYGGALGLTLVNLGLCAFAALGTGAISRLWRDRRQRATAASESRKSEAGLRDREVTREAPRPLHEAPRPLHEAPRPLREAPPPLREAPPPLREAPPPLRTAPPPLRTAPPPSRRAQGQPDEAAPERAGGSGGRERSECPPARMPRQGSARPAAAREERLHTDRRG